MGWGPSACFGWLFYQYDLKKIGTFLFQIFELLEAFVRTGSFCATEQQKKAGSSHSSYFHHGYLAVIPYNAIIIIKVFIKRKILSVRTILSTYTHAHTHARTHAHRGTRAQEYTDYTMFNLHTT